MKVVLGYGAKLFAGTASGNINDMATLISDMQNNNVLGNVNGDAMKKLAEATIKEFGSKYKPEIVKAIANTVGPQL